MNQSPDGGEAAWFAAAAAVLRKMGRLGADAPDSEVWDRLATKTVEGLTVPPLGTARRAAGLRPPGAPGRPPYTRGSPTAERQEWDAWDVRPLVADPDPVAANSAILAELEGGATSIWLRLGGSATATRGLPVALAGVHADLAPIALSATGDVTDLALAQAFATWCAGVATRPHPNSSLGADPIGRAVRSDSADPLSALAEIASVAGGLGVRAIVVDGSAAHEAGAGDAAEIGYVLATGAAYLRELAAAGVHPEVSVRLLEARFAVTADQFASIAKLRAARLTWHRFLELCGVPAAARGQRQHAVTSAAMLTRYDPWVNLLRTTVSAFAAGVGGAESVTVLPFDAALGAPGALGRRMARNVSALLVHESHVAKATDPAGGAYAVEMMTAEIAEAAWAEFQQIEASGGILPALADGSWRSRIDQVAAQRRRLIASRRQPITGVSEFPLDGEVLPTRTGAPLTDGVDRWAAPFEDLRDEPAGSPVVLLTVGSRADAAARTLFVENLLAAGGVPIAPDGPGAELPGAVVIVVGSDAGYAEGGTAAIADARSRGARRLFLAGRPPEQLRDLVDGHVAAGDDVLAFLRRLRDGIGASA